MQHRTLQISGVFIIYFFCEIIFHKTLQQYCYIEHYFTKKVDYKNCSKIYYLFASSLLTWIKLHKIPEILIKLILFSAN